MKNTIEIYLEVTNGYIETISKKIEIETTKNTDAKFFNFKIIDNSNIRSGLEYIKNDFETQLEDFELFWYSKPVNTLREFGLLVL